MAFSFSRKHGSFFSFLCSAFLRVYMIENLQKNSKGLDMRIWRLFPILLKVNCISYALFKVMLWKVSVPNTIFLRGCLFPFSFTFWKTLFFGLSAWNNPAVGKLLLTPKTLNNCGGIYGLTTIFFCLTILICQVGLSWEELWVGGKLSRAWV